MTVSTQQSIVMATTGEYSNTPKEATPMTEQSTDIATKVIATADQSTNTPLETIVTTEPLSMDTPTEGILNKEQSVVTPAEAIEGSTDTPKEAIVTTKQFMDIAPKVIATTEQSMDTPKETVVSPQQTMVTTITTAESTNTPTKTLVTKQQPMVSPSIAMVTTGVSIYTPTKTLVPTEQSMDTLTEAIEHSTDTPKGVIAATQQSMFTPNVAIVTKEESMITPTEVILTTEQSIDIAIEAVATVEQSVVTPTAITTKEKLTYTSTQARVKTDQSTDIATGVIATSKQSMVTPNKGIVSATQTIAPLIPVSSMVTVLEVTVEVSAKTSFNLTTEDSQGVNRNATDMTLSTSAVAFENSKDDGSREGSVISGLGKTKGQVDGVGGTALQPSLNPTPGTLPEPRKDIQPEIEILESTLPDANTSQEPLLSDSDDIHEGAEITSGSIIVEEVSGTAERPSESDLSERTESEYSVSEEIETFAGAEVLLEAPTNKLYLAEGTSEAEDVHASASAKDISFDKTYVDITEDATEAVPPVENKGEAQSEMTVETAVHEVPLNTMTEILAVENEKPDSTGDVGPPEVIPDTNGKDVTLAVMHDPSVIILDVEDFMPEVTPTIEDYTSGSHNTEIDIKEETPEENSLESTAEGKMPEVLEDTTSTLPEMKGTEGVENDMSKDTGVLEDTTLDVPKTAPSAVIPDVTTSEVPKTVDRSVGTLKEDDTPAPSVEVEKSTVGLKELTTNMQRNTISSTVQASTQISNNVIDEGNMVCNHCLRDSL